MTAPGWADDLCWPLSDPEPQVLLNKATRLAEIVHHECTRRAMQPNYSPGKTELLVGLHGKNSYRTKQALFGKRQATVCFAGTEGEIQLGCVQKYKHLGTLLTSSLKALPDMRRKTGSALAVALPLARSVFRRQDVPVAKRAELLRTLALNKATHAAATWIPTDAAELAHWAAGYTRLIRLLLPEDRHTQHPQHPSGAEACAAAGVPLPAAFLALERLSYVVTLASGLHAALWEELLAEDTFSQGSWWSLAESDVDWLNSACTGMPRFFPYKGLQALFDAAVHAPNTVKNWLRKARLGAVTQTKLAAIEQVKMRQNQALHPCLTPAAVLGCSFCGQLFGTPQKLCVHRANKHGVRSPIDAYAGSRTCRACLTNFHTRKRLLRHLYHDSARCASTVQHLGPLTEAELCQARQEAARFNSDNRASGRSLAPHTLPAYRLQGPLPKSVEDVFDPSLLALCSELQAAAQADDCDGFVLQVREQVELLINSPSESFHFVQSLLPERYSTVLGGLRA